MTLSQTSFVLNDLIVLRRTHEVYCRKSLHWDLFNVFLMIGQESCFLERKTIKVLFASLYIKDAYHRYDV